MTDVLEGRVRVAAARPSSARTDSVASVWVRGAFAAAWAAALGVASLVVLALVVWAADSQTGANAGGAMRLAAQLWLVAHRTPLRITGGSLTLPPLGLTLVLGLLVARATSIVARGTTCRDLRDFGVIVASVALPYGILATVLATATPSASIKPSAGAAFVCAVVVGGLFASIGAARGAGVTRTAWRTIPIEWRTSLRAAGAAAAIMLGAATLLTMGSMLVHLHQLTAISNRYQGTPGIFSMLLLSLVLVPNAVIFSIGYLAGPGFAIGSGTSVALGGAHVGAMPALPLLATVPAGRAPLPVLLACILAMVAAGALAGRRVVRGSTLSVRGQVNSALGAAATLGLGTAILVGFAGGPSGPGRLSEVGPSPWQVGLAVTGEIAVVAVIVVLVANFAAGRRDQGPRPTSSPAVVTLP